MKLLVSFNDFAKALDEYFSFFSGFELFLMLFVALVLSFVVIAVFLTDGGMRHWPRK